MQRARMPEIAYVRRVLVGNLSRAAFVRTQIQFLFAVEPYADCLAMLAARCESAEARRVLEQNVRDEQGAGDPDHAHGATFRALLGKFGVTAAQIDASARWPCVEAFNAGVREACTTGPEQSGIATIAAIEDLFTHVSSELGRGIVVQGWLAREEVVHYNVHKELDRIHADALYALLDPTNESVAPGLSRGVELLVDLYAGLLEP
jgi:pyrroloquinoline quinone (PQQ) biosynthesis protein C